MKEDESRRVARAWIDFQSNWWAWDKLDEYCRQDAAAAWGVLKIMVELADSDELLEDIGVGPLEDFVNNYADEYVDELDRAASTSTALQQALGHVQIRDETLASAGRLVDLGCKPAGETPAE